MRSHRDSLLAAMAIGMMGAGLNVPGPPLRDNFKYKPTPQRMDTAQQREIAEHNSEVERKRQAKLARRRSK